MLELSCLCGQVRVSTAKRPDFVHECNCTLCSKSGARWAYLHPADVTVEGATSGYSRTDKGEASADLRFCGTCGATTHFALTPDAVAKHGNTMMGINTRLADERALAGIELRYPDGRAWAGDGAFGYVRPPRILGEPDAG